MGWIKKATDRMEEKGTAGSFTRIAKRLGMSTGAAASEIMANKDKYPASTVKKANFAKNAAKK